MLVRTTNFISQNLSWVWIQVFGKEERLTIERYVSRCIDGTPRLVQIRAFSLNHRGNTFVLVVTNFCTKWTERYLIPNQEASKVAEKLVEVICHFAMTYTTSPNKMAYWSSFIIPLARRPTCLCWDGKLKYPYMCNHWVNPGRCSLINWVWLALQQKFASAKRGSAAALRKGGQTPEETLWLVSIQ